MSIRPAVSKILLASSLFLFSVTSFADTKFTSYVNDALGSPVVAMNQAGDVIWRKTYQPYGKASGNDRDNRIGYTGHVEDKPDLVYAGARYYDPALSIFLSDDPVRFTEKNPMSFNRYAYANNNPYKFVDPDGRKVEFAWSQGNDAVFRSAIAELMKSEHGRRLYNKLDTDKDSSGKDVHYKITDADIKNKASYDFVDKVISIDPNWSAKVQTTEGKKSTPLSILLGHEIGHAATYTLDVGLDNMDNVNENENPIRRELGYPERTKYK